MFVGVPWNPREVMADPPGGVRKRYITKSLVQELVHCCNNKSCYDWLRRSDQFIRLRKLKQQPQQLQPRVMIQITIEAPPQASSSSHEDPMQVNTTPPRARIPEDEEDATTVRPPLGTSALIGEVCERDVPEIHLEKLGEKSSSVFDIYTGLKLDGAQVKDGREREAKRMLEFDVYAEVSEEVACGKRICNRS